MGFIRFDNGACLQIEFSWASNIESDQIFVELRGEKSGSKLLGTENRFEIYTEECGTLATLRPATDDYRGLNHHEGNIRHFIDVIEGKCEPDFTPIQGVNMVKIGDQRRRGMEREKYGGRARPFYDGFSVYCYSRYRSLLLDDGAYNCTRSGRICDLRREFLSEIDLRRLPSGDEPD